MPKIKISPCCFLFAFFICYSMPLSSLVPLATSVFFHESGHLIAALICKSPIECVLFSPLGVTIRRKSTLSAYLHDIVIYSFGPLLSLILGITGYYLGIDGLYNYSFALLLLNILPVKVFDGGKILYSLLCIICTHRADFVLKTVSAVIVTLLWLISLFLVLVSNASPSLLIMCFYLFFAIFV